MKSVLFTVFLLVMFVLSVFSSSEAYDRKHKIDTAFGYALSGILFLFLVFQLLNIIGVIES